MTHPIVPPHLLQVLVEDGTYGVTLPPTLLREDDSDGVGGEEGFLDWEWGAGTPRCHNEPIHPLLCQGLSWNPALILWDPPTPSWLLEGVCSLASPCLLASW